MPASDADHIDLLIQWHTTAVTTSERELDHRDQHGEAGDHADDDTAGPQPALPHRLSQINELFA